MLGLLWLAWLAIDARQQLLLLSQPALISPAVSTPIPRPSPDPTAIAGMFGLQPQVVNDSVVEVPLTLLASLVAVDGQGSRALIQDPDGQRFYQQGETLPGGAVLQQISAGQVLLQRFGQSHSLPLQNAPSSHLLQAQPATGQRVNHQALSLLVQP
ncbi:type II secretion system protein N [Pseudomonas sp. 5P_3.1_Bac2]|uniref:type II secretion system protein N n=1 Tax=Pseudomonas sp. 5P_3.1_Bac2 TaxID=2971617 RepID=UPI0021C5A16D|nr:type II secretion system protein N [Pseudomonas sp. 5P_3.1_Bac2]MCU1717750.1 protein XcpP [Pseudomonas sp. 5P_3.1_Bac2]